MGINSVEVLPVVEALPIPVRVGARDGLIKEKGELMRVVRDFIEDLTLKEEDRIVRSLVDILLRLSIKPSLPRALLPFPGSVLPETHFLWGPAKKTGILVTINFPAYRQGEPLSIPSIRRIYYDERKPGKKGDTGYIPWKHRHTHGIRPKNKPV